MLIGSVYTREEVDEFAKENGIQETRFNGKRYALGKNEYVFKVDGDDYLLIETRESRIEDMSDVCIQRKEMKKSKHYYDRREI